MRFAAMVKIDDRQPVHGDVDLTLPGEGLGMWSVEVQGCEDVYFAGEKVDVGIRTARQSFIGQALPTRFTNPGPLGGPPMLTLVGDGDLFEVERSG